MTLTYSVLMEPLSPDDGGGYLASVPDLPGCMSDGATPEEALRNVEDAIDGWLDAAKAWDMTIPPAATPHMAAE